MLILFDIDGTLADLSHRFHLIDRPRKDKDWDSFHKLAIHDTPIPEMIELCRHLMTSHTIVFVTGRNKVCKPATEAWLRKHLVIPHGYGLELYMRLEEDRRPDYQVKADILAAIRNVFGKTPDMVFEDRQQVVDMYRDEGIRVLQVDKGDF